ncbi:MAG: hypothetical protein GXP10_03930 [Gammaproteobacteria bacterium]|nr:hypothetical protein [Gammaproteobacteria bacterium]
MMEFIVETVVISFTVGGILGGIIGVSLKSSKQWSSDQEPLYCKIDEHDNRRR